MEVQKFNNRGKELLPYWRGQFIGREKELEMVRMAIGNIDQFDTSRTVVFHGERGAGKTWLAHKAAEELVEMGVPTTFIGGDVFYKKHLPKLRNVTQRREEGVRCIIFDGIFEADWGFLQQAEHEFLAQLAKDEETLLILTGRGRLYPWESPQLRIRVVPYYDANHQEFQPLAGFSPQETYEQLRRQAPQAKDNSELIWEMTGGHPKANVVLAQAKDMKKGIQTAYHDVIDPAARDKKIQREIAMLSLLDRGFRETEIGLVLETFTTQKELSKSEMRKNRDAILDTYLMHWRDGKFVIDNPVRTLAQSHLRMSDPRLWNEINTFIADTYADWANRFSDHSGFFEELASHYRQKIVSL